MSRVLALVAGALAIAFLGWQFWLGSRGADECGGGAVAGGSIGGALSLLDETGKEVTEADLFQKPALVYFGYSFCPDVCPLDNVRNVEAMDLLKARGIAISTYFVTVDPARDTPQVLAEYTDNIHPDLIGLSGSAAQTKAAADAYRVFYRANLDQGEFYMVDHTTFTYLILPGGAFADFFKREDSPETIAERAACMIGAAG